MIEAEVHQVLKAFFKSSSGHPSPWNHHLTMGRLVARALRGGKSALINTSSFPSVHSWSYLTAALISGRPLMLVIKEPWRSLLVNHHLPSLINFLGKTWPVYCDPYPPPGKNPGIYVMTPDQWLGHNLGEPGGIDGAMALLIEQAEQLPEWIRQSQTITVTPHHWLELKQWGPWERIETYQIKLTQAIFRRPINPHHVYGFDATVEKLLTTMMEEFRSHPIPWPYPWNLWQTQWQRSGQMNYLTIDRDRGGFSLYSSPLEVHQELQRLLQHQPNVLVGNFGQKPYFHFDGELDHHTRVDFAPDHRCDPIQLYLPYRLPLPNTAEFAPALITQLEQLLSLYDHHFVVLLIDDVPLKSRVGATLASIFGSKIKIETLEVGPGGVLICSWDFWLDHQSQLAIPTLLVISTIPFPSLEHPLVALRVEHHKSRKENWFKMYLLPMALRRMQNAIASVRQHQGTIALLDTRVNSRSYGPEILQSLEPYGRVSQPHGLEI